MRYHLPEILEIARGAVRPVYAPAIIYGSTLDTWTAAMTADLADAVARVNKQGITVWLRLLFEMVSLCPKGGAEEELMDR